MWDINNHLAAYERSLYEEGRGHSIPSVLVLMVKRLFSPLKYPYALFPSSAVTAGKLCTIPWEAVGRLELIGFRVLGGDL